MRRGNLGEGEKQGEEKILSLSDQDDKIRYDKIPTILSNLI
jgi:hypothetical protein